LRTGARSRTVPTKFPSVSERCHDHRVADAGHAMRLAALLGDRARLRRPCAGCRNRAAVHRVLRMSAAGRITSSGSGLARPCHRERRFLPRSRWMCAMSIGFPSEGWCSNTVMTSFPPPKLIAKEETLALPPELGKLWSSAIAYQAARLSSSEHSRRLLISLSTHWSIRTERNHV
jgi:hypothetical protein